MTYDHVRGRCDGRLAGASPVPAHRCQPMSSSPRRGIIKTLSVKREAPCSKQSAMVWRVAGRLWDYLAVVIDAEFRQ